MSTSSPDRLPFSSLTPELFHQRYRARSRPVIIEGAFDGVDDWTLDVLAENLGTAEYGVRVYGSDYRSRRKRDWKTYCEIEQLTAPAYVDRLRDRTAHERSMYMAQVAFGATPLAATIRDRIRQLEQKCDMQTCNPLMDLSLWLGPGGHTEPLHFDNFDGTLMQLHGAKRVTLFPPSQTVNLYPYPFFTDIPPWFSQVDTDERGAGDFPKFADARRHAIEFVLQQGEILFIPVSWWHEVTALGTDYVCSVNRFWKTKPFVRNFAHRRASVFWLMNQVPWSAVVAFDGLMRRVSRRAS